LAEKGPPSTLNRRSYRFSGSRLSSSEQRSAPWPQSWRACGRISTCVCRQGRILISGMRRGVTRLLVRLARSSSSSSGLATAQQSAGGGLSTPGGLFGASTVSNARKHFHHGLGNGSSDCRGTAGLNNSLNSFYVPFITRTLNSSQFAVCMCLRLILDPGRISF